MGGFVSGGPRISWLVALPETSPRVSLSKNSVSQLAIKAPCVKVMNYMTKQILFLPMNDFAGWQWDPTSHYYFADQTERDDRVHSDDPIGPTISLIDTSSPM
jgi:hypothetical protein